MRFFNQLFPRSLGSTVGACVGVGIGAYFFVFMGGGSTPLERFADYWGLKSYDLPVSLKPTTETPDVVIVYIDQESAMRLNEPVGEPWNRERTHAKLLRRLVDEKPRGVVFDLVFGERSNSTADEALAAALQSVTNVILGLAVQPSNTALPLGQLSASSEPPRDFSQAAAAVGFPGLDQTVIRQHPPTVNNVLPLSQAALKVLAPSLDASPRTQERRWVNFYGPSGWIPSVSYWQALDTNEVPQGYFQNKIVFIGIASSATPAGQRLDVFETPHHRSGQEPFISGVEIQATLLLNLLRDDALRKLSAGKECCLIIAFGLLYGLRLPKLSPLRMSVAATITLLAIAACGWWMLTQAGVWFRWTVIIAQIAGIALWSLGLHFWTSVLHNRLTTQSIATYVSPAQARRITKSGAPTMLQPSPAKQMISILFSDIANFTPMSEGMDPDALAALMKKYFELAVNRCFFKTEATIVKFSGDAIFAIWNSPEIQPDHCERACRTALLFRDVMDFSAGEAALSVRTRIGLHCGQASVGNFGTATRVDFSAFGENVNLASRMEGLNKHLGTSILATAELMDSVQGLFITRPLGRFQLKGFNRVVEVFELIAERERGQESHGWREAFAEGLAFFQRKQWPEAEEAMRRVLEAKAEDGPASFYLKQFQKLKQENLPENWDGVVSLVEK